MKLTSVIARILWDEPVGDGVCANSSISGTLATKRVSETPFSWEGGGNKFSSLNKPTI